MTISEASTVVDVPALLTVAEAAHVLRIGRTSAYRLAREFLASDGASGIPAVRVGRQLRVPRRTLEVLIGARLHATAMEPTDECTDPNRMLRITWISHDSWVRRDVRQSDS